MLKTPLKTINLRNKLSLSKIWLPWLGLNKLMQCVNKLIEFVCVKVSACDIYHVIMYSVVMFVLFRLCAC